MLRNREAWDGGLSAGFIARARKQWAAEPHWGLWAVPQAELAVLPAELAGKEVIELGCGTAYVDVAISEHGASAWCDPHMWIPEVARLLRPGGELIFMRDSDLLTLCVPDKGPAGISLVRQQAGLSRLDNAGGGVTFALPHGPLIRLLRDSGFVVEDLLEVWPGENPVTDFDYVDAEWARRWPAEEVWKARRNGEEGFG